MRRALLATLAIALLATSACSEDEDPKLQGTRIPVREIPEHSPPEIPEQHSLPPLQAQENWTQRGGSPRRGGGNLEGPSSLTLAWNVSAGYGTEDTVPNSGPVIVDGTVYVRDGETNVLAFDAASGAKRWEVDLTPEHESSEVGYGGGLAFDEGRLFATTGFGQVVALDPSTGEEFWRASGDAPYRAGPAALDGVVIAVNRADIATAYDGETGEKLWDAPSGLKGKGNMEGAVPAMGADVVALPYGSGEVMLARKNQGFGIWTGTLFSKGLIEGLAAFPDITSDPALGPGPSVAAGNAGGALALFDGRSGQRVWQRDFGSLNPVWFAGDTLYAATTEPALVRLDVVAGETLWRAALPAWKYPDDKEGPLAYGGPVLVGGRVLVTSSDGKLLAFDPQTGAKLDEIEMPGGSRTGPTVAGDMIYVLTDDGNLLAYR